MSTLKKLWPKLKKSKRYRETFVAQHAKQDIGFQIRELLKQAGLTQAELAKRANLTQGVVSRAADPAYGNLTINTLVRIAAGFDVVFVGRFLPFSELPKWFDRLQSEPFTVDTFEIEDSVFEREEAATNKGAAFRSAVEAHEHAQALSIEYGARPVALAGIAEQQSTVPPDTGSWLSRAIARPKAVATLDGQAENNLIQFPFKQSETDSAFSSLNQSGSMAAAGAGSRPVWRE